MPWDKGLSIPADITSRWFHDYVYEHPARALRVVMDTPYGPDVVYKEAEYADPLTRLGLLVGGIDEQDEFQSLSLTDDGRLKVDAHLSLSTTEIEVEIDVLDGDRIGIWGYQDADLNLPTPVNVTSAGEVRVEVTANDNVDYLFNETSIPSGAETAIISYTIPASNNFHLYNATATGGADALFRLKINTDTVSIKRNNWCDRNMIFDFSKGLKIEEGDVISVTVFHSESTSIPFSSTIYGELV